MLKLIFQISLFIALLFVNQFSFSQTATCPKDKPFVLQILGSGGPRADDGRASSGYLVWINGKAKILVDAGGGIFLRYAQSKADFNDLELLALSHLHIDHVADVPALLKSAFFLDRKRPLIISGPSGNDTFPDVKSYLIALFSPKFGIFRYLSGFLTGTRGLFKLEPVQVDVDTMQAIRVYDKDNIVVDALAVPHAIIPALAYRIQFQGKTLVLGGDQNGSNPKFINFAHNANLLLMHAAIPEKTGRIEKLLHARPSVIAKVASKSNAQQLVLSHLMQRSLANIDDNVKIIKKNFHRPIIVAKDLQCVVIG